MTKISIVIKIIQNEDATIDLIKSDHVEGKLNFSNVAKMFVNKELFDTLKGWLSAVFISIVTGPGESISFRRIQLNGMLVLPTVQTCACKP